MGGGERGRAVLLRRPGPFFVYLGDKRRTPQHTHQAPASSHLRAGQQISTHFWLRDPKLGRTILRRQRRLNPPRRGWCAPSAPRVSLARRRHFGFVIVRDDQHRSTHEIKSQRHAIQQGSKDTSAPPSPALIQAQRVELRNEAIARSRSLDRRCHATSTPYRLALPSKGQDKRCSSLSSKPSGLRDQF